MPWTVFGLAALYAATLRGSAVDGWSVAVGGAAILWTGPTADLAAVAHVSELLGGGEPSEHDGLVVLPKLRPTPAGYPRRSGGANKRPPA